MFFITIFVMAFVLTMLIVPTLMWVTESTSIGVPWDLVGLLTVVACVVSGINVVIALGEGKGFESLSWLGWPLGVFIATSLLHELYERRQRSLKQ